MSRFIVAFALLAPGVLAAMPAPASAAVRTFRSPTGNVGCLFSSNSEMPPQVRCEWRGGNDRAVLVTERGKGRRIKITDTVMDPNAKVLAYGRSTRFGSLRCTSRTTGITCRSARSEHGFTVSVQKQKVF